eukprot:1194015-Prorocentrum_minimum.AAC.1
MWGESMNSPVEIWLFKGLMSVSSPTRCFLSPLCPATAHAPSQEPRYPLSQPVSGSTGTWGSLGAVVRVVTDTPCKETAEEFSSPVVKRLSKGSTGDSHLRRFLGVGKETEGELNSPVVKRLAKGIYDRVDPYHSRFAQGTSTTPSPRAAGGRERSRPAVPSLRTA